MSNISSRRSSNASGIPNRNPPQEEEEVSPVKRFFTGYVFTTAMSLLACAVIGLLGAIKDGYRWRTSYSNETSGASRNVVAAKMFAFHPLFMTIALIFLNSQASLIWRTLRHKKFSRQAIKLFHAGFQFGTFILVVFGLHAVFTSHKMTGKANVDEAHSWLGIFVVCILVLQMVFGFAAFLFPQASRQTKLWYLDYHRFFGVVVMLVATVVVCMGMAMYQSYGWGMAGILSRIYVLAILLYGISLAYSFSNNKFQSPLGQQQEEKSIYADINGQPQYS